MTPAAIVDHFDTLYRATARVNPAVAFAAVDWLREVNAPSHPEIAMLSDAGLQRDADFWADFASEGQVVAMMAACLKRLARHSPIGTATKKRAIVALWNSLNEADRAAFLEMVDPGSKAKA